MRTLTFKTTVDNSGLRTGLKQMETETVKASAKIEAETKRVGQHMGSLVRPVGDVLDAITGQRGYVMKLQALTHGLGFGLAAATGGLVAAGLAAKLYQSADAADTLDKSIKGLHRSQLSSSGSSMSSLHETLEAGQALKEQAASSRGTNLSLEELQSPKLYTKPMMALKQLKNMALDVAEIILNPSGDKFSGTNDQKDKAQEDASRAIQQNAADKIGEKLQKQLEIKKAIWKMDGERAAFLKQEIDGDEKVGAILQMGMKYGVDMTKAAQAQLDLNQKETQELAEQVRWARSRYEIEHDSATPRSASLVPGMNSATAAARQNEFTKYFNRTQETNFLQRRIKDSQGYIGGTMQGAAGAERRAELQDSITKDKNRLRDLAIQRELMSPDQRRQEKRDDLREKHAIDRADRKSMQGMTPDEKKAFKAEKDAAMGASSKTSKSSIDDGSITKLTNAITAGIAKLLHG